MMGCTNGSSHDAKYECKHARSMREGDASASTNEYDEASLNSDEQDGCWYWYNTSYRYEMVPRLISQLAG